VHGRLAAASERYRQDSLLADTMLTEFTRETVRWSGIILAVFVIFVAGMSIGIFSKDWFAWIFVPLFFVALIHSIYSTRKIISARNDRERGVSVTRHD
jgi:hypothetical protein